MSKAKQRVVIAEFMESSIALWKKDKKNHCPFCDIKGRPRSTTLAPQTVLSLDNNASL